MVSNGMQLKFSLQHGLQHAVVDKGTHVEACNKLCDVARWSVFYFMCELCQYVHRLPSNHRQYLNYQKVCHEKVALRRKKLSWAGIET